MTLNAKKSLTFEVKLLSLCESTWRKSEEEKSEIFQKILSTFLFNDSFFENKKEIRKMLLTDLYQSKKNFRLVRM